MKMHQALWGSVVLSFLAAITGSLVSWNTPAFAATTTTTLTVPVSGTVSGPLESVSISGNVRITTSTDPALAAAPVVLSIDLTGVVGKGQSTGAAYVVTPQG